MYRVIFVLKDESEIVSTETFKTPEAASTWAAQELLADPAGESVVNTKIKKEVQVKVLCTIGEGNGLVWAEPGTLWVPGNDLIPAEQGEEIYSNNDISPFETAISTGECEKCELFGKCHKPCKDVTNYIEGGNEE